MTQFPSFSESVSELQAVLNDCESLFPLVSDAAQALVACLKNGGKLLTCGNGGSAADALHLAEEVVGCYKVRRRALPAICVNADVTALTCIANDYGYDEVFARQIEALGRPEDVLVVFSTSGNSDNILAAISRAKQLNLVTILLSGKGGGHAKGMCDYELIVPSDTTARIQEVHTLILHQWLENIDAQDWPVQEHLLS
jgi:D-sedoheptulose 7-phosphate isomerase